MHNTNASRSVPDFKDDGLGITAAEPWFKVKVEVIQSYLHSFVSHVAGRVDEIVYVDLSARAGLYSLGHQKEIFAGASLTALAANLPISRWILCEQDAAEARALKTRVDRWFGDKDVTLFDHAPDALIDRLRTAVPQRKGGPKVAVFCLMDPFSLSIPFSLIQKLTAMGFSFLIPFTFGLNQRRDYKFYLGEQSDSLEQFLGGKSNIDRLKSAQSNVQFYKRLVRMYQNNTLMLGLSASLSAHHLSSGLMELPAYYVGFFSAQFSTRQIQQEVRAGEHVQFELFDV